MPEEKKEIADFSDMGKSSLPDTIEETPMGDQHVAISYEDEESLKQGGQPQEQTPQETETPEEKSAKYWQSKHDQDVAAKEKELQELRSQQQQYSKGYQDLQREIVQMREQLTPKPKEEVLTEPQRPDTDDPNVILKWQSDYLQYQNKLIQKQNQQFQSVQQNWEQEMNRRKQDEEYARMKAFHLSQLQRTGLSPEEAQEAFLMYSKAQENPEDYYKDLGEFYRYKRGQFGSTKGDQMGKRATRQGEIPSLVNVTSETETQKKDPAKEFWADMKQFEKRYY